MFDPHISIRRAVTSIVLLALAFLWPSMSAASSGFFSETDLDQAEPVEITSHIMSIDYGKGTLVVAEKTKKAPGPQRAWRFFSAFY